MRLHAFLALVNPRAAASAFQSLKTAPHILKTQPHVGSPLPEFSPREVRRLIVDDYELRYEVKLNEVWVLRIWHTREHR